MTIRKLSDDDTKGLEILSCSVLVYNYLQKDHRRWRKWVDRSTLEDCNAPVFVAFYLLLSLWQDPKLNRAEKYLPPFRNKCFDTPTKKVVSII
jgi:hypothetical protein